MSNQDYRHYFDYAAATPLDERVREAMAPYESIDFYNPSSPYLAAKQVKQAIAGTRGKVASLLGARPSEVIFTTGGTEANNLAIMGVALLYPKSHIIISAIEHAAVTEPAEYLQHNGWSLDICPVQPNGQIDLGKLADLIRKDTVLISIIHSNNEIGTIQPLAQIASLLETERARRVREKSKLPIYFHTDACQSANYIDTNQFKRAGADLVTLNAAKLYGPKQTGALYVRAGVEIQPLIHGGGQERGLRGGTENVAGIIGFAKALDIAQSERSAEAKRLSELRQYFIDQLSDLGMHTQINGTSKHQLPSIVNVSFEGLDGERLVMLLDEMGFQVATGAACSEDKDGPSHVLIALGRTKEEASASLRISFGRFTDQSAIDDLIKAIHEAVGLAQAIAVRS